MSMWCVRCVREIYTCGLDRGRVQSTTWEREKLPEKLSVVDWLFSTTDERRRYIYMQSLKRRNLLAVVTSSLLTQRLERTYLSALFQNECSIESGQQMPYDSYYILRCIRLFFEAFNASIRFGINFRCFFFLFFSICCLVRWRRPFFLSNKLWLPLSFSAPNKLRSFN